MTKTVNALLLILVSSVTVFSFNSTVPTRDVFDTWFSRVKEHPECVSSSAVTENDLDQFFLHYQLPSTTSFKCFLTCFYGSYDLTHENGTINVDEVVKDVARITYETAAACAGKARNIPDKCQIVYVFQNCILHGNSFELTE
ncbi:uncharacterized protein LOC116181123 [Photinus pyralis]|uniref:uncharacterized protein LOC116181123 n=1 Tax=Photinus pyralis TaxID=7054 RepID=UPI0012670BBD|nr:uncharacterized protein LOC116181123 [Photinus pyralis]